MNKQYQLSAIVSTSCDKMRCIISVFWKNSHKFYEYNRDFKGGRGIFFLVRPNNRNKLNEGFEPVTSSESRLPIYLEKEILEKLNAPNPNN